MARGSQRDNQTVTTKLWSVVVLCENSALYGYARAACEQMAKKYPIGAEFQFRWWLFDDLTDSQERLAAIGAAASADMIVFAVSSEGELPEMIKAWVEEWLFERGGREGTIVGLFPDTGEICTTRKYCYLRQIACRGQMDFMSALPAILPSKLPDNFDWVSRRAGEVTSVLNEILRGPSSPPMPPF